MTLEELEQYVLELESNYNNTFNQFEKELAVLKGRTDLLEYKVGELEYNQYRNFRGAVLIVDAMDLNTGEIKKSSKAIQCQKQKNRWTRPRANNSGMFVSYNSAVLFEESNNTGNWPLVRISHFGDASLSGKELTIGGNDFDGANYYNFGAIPSPEGGWFVINKQKLDE